MSIHEWISRKKVKPIKEIKIKDVKKYLFKLAKEDKIKITMYKKGSKESGEEDIFNVAKGIKKKYGHEIALKGIKKYHPSLEKSFKKFVKGK